MVVDSPGLRRGQGLSRRKGSPTQPCGQWCLIRLLLYALWLLLHSAEVTLMVTITSLTVLLHGGLWDLRFVALLPPTSLWCTSLCSCSAASLRHPRVCFHARRRRSCRWYCPEFHFAMRLVELEVGLESAVQGLCHCLCINAVALLCVPYDRRQSVCEPL